LREQLLSGGYDERLAKGRERYMDQGKRLHQPLKIVSYLLSAEVSAH